jgi:hypothetical protein
VPAPAHRAPSLFGALRTFCLGAFFELGRELENGAEIPVSFEEHSALGRPTLYEYRPLVGAFVEIRAARLARRDDARDALATLKDEPAVGIFARAHAGSPSSEDEALTRTILVPLLVATAEACGGFDWDDDGFERAYVWLERSLFGESRWYVAVAPLVGLTAGEPVELARGLRVRPATAEELAELWPDARQLLPRDFGREVDRSLVLELGLSIEGSAIEPPDAPMEVARAVSALRLAVPGSLAAGPVLFERLDRRPYGVRPVPPLAAQAPAAEPNRLDRFRARLVAQLVERLAESPVDPEMLEALERWELALFHEGPQRADELREALESLLGFDDGPWAAAMRASVLLGESSRERRELAGALRGLVDGDGAGAFAEDAVRKALLEALLHGDRARLVMALDEALLGLRPRPQVTISARVLATV